MTATATPTLVQVWSGPRAEAGVEAYGALPLRTAGRVIRAITGAQSFTFTTTRAVADEAGIAEGRFLWVSHPLFGVSEWVILTVVDGAGTARSTVRVTAGPIAQALTLRGTIRTVNTYGEVTNSFTLPALRVDTIMGLYFTPNRDLDGCEWVTFGTSDYAGTIQIGPVAQWTRARLLSEIASATGYEWDWVRVDNDGYRVNLVRRLGEDATVPVLETGKNVASIERTRDLIAGSTVVEPRDTSGAPMRDPWWTVQQITGSGPYWVTLADPASGPPVIREDDQCVGAFLRPLDGLPVEITDSRGSDSSVLIADRTGLVVGGLASIWATEDGGYFDALTSPTGLVARKRVVQAISVPVPDLYANLLVDPALKGALSLWETVYPSGGGADVFDRTDDRAPTMRINGALASGVSSIVVDGALKDDGSTGVDLPIRFGDAITVEGVVATVSATTNTDASGNATLPLSPVLSAAISSGVAMVWKRGTATIGSATTNGAQALGAANLLLSGLTATPALTVSDTFVYTVQPAQSFINGVNAIDVVIPNATAVSVVDTYRRSTFVGGVLGVETVVIPWASSLTAQANPGDTTVSLDLTNQPASSGTLLSRAISYVPPSISYTFTLAAAPPAWNTSLISTPNLTGATGVAVPANATLSWQRAGAVLGTVRAVVGASAVATSIQIELTSGFGRVLVSDTFELPAQTLYSASQKLLSAAGAGTIALRVNTTAAIADNALVTVRRCQDYKDAEFGSPVVLRLRGDRATAPTTYRGTGYSLYSPVLRVQSPTGSGTYYCNFGVGLTRWAAEAAQSQRGWFCVWDADTGAQLTVQGWTTVSPAYTPVFDVETHTDPDIFVTLTRPSRLRLSLHPGGGDVGDGVGGFTFLRWVSATVSTNGVPLALVDGAGTNALWHRGQDLIEARSNAARYRVTLSSIAAFADDADALLVLGGTVRLRDAATSLDVTVRVVHLEYAIDNLDDMVLEIQVLTPRFTEAPQ